MLLSQIVGLFCVFPVLSSFVTTFIFKFPDEKLNEKQTKEEWKEENSEADEVISRVTQMVEILSEENSALRKELKNCHTKAAHAQEVCTTNYTLFFI